MSRADFRRPPRRPKVVGPRVLIACEGIACEPSYFHGIRMDLRLPEGRIRVVPHGGTDPPGIVNAVLEEREQAIRDRAWNPETDQAWAVFDVDDKKRDYPAQWNTAKQRAGDRVRLAISNPAFELWYLLHFRDQRGHIDRVAARRALRDLLGEYEKSMALYPQLKDRTSSALERAEQLLRMHERERPDEDEPNPSTGVWELVRHLLTLTPL